MEVSERAKEWKWSKKTALKVINGFMWKNTDFLWRIIAHESNLGVLTLWCVRSHCDKDPPVNVMLWVKAEHCEKWNKTDTAKWCCTVRVGDSSTGRTDPCQSKRSFGLCNSCVIDMSLMGPCGEFMYVIKPRCGLTGYRCLRGYHQGRTSRRPVSRRNWLLSIVMFPGDVTLRQVELRRRETFIGWVSRCSMMVERPCIVALSASCEGRQSEEYEREVDVSRSSS